MEIIERLIEVINKKVLKLNIYDIKSSNYGFYTINREREIVFVESNKMSNKKMVAIGADFGPFTTIKYISFNDFRGLEAF